jgi:hypothetical protein
MEIFLIIKNKFGEFRSKPIMVDDEDYENIVELSKGFYLSGYEMDTEEGFVVMPPEIIKESILIIQKNETDQGTI